MRLPMRLHNLTKSRAKDWETVRVFDEIAGHPWTAYVPLAVLHEKLPLSCRYTQEIAFARYLAMGILGGMAFMLGFILFFTFASLPILGQLLAAGLVIPLGVLLGYLKGYELFMASPVWVVRRMYKRKLPNGKEASDIRDIQELEIDYESFPILQPIEHTKLTGLPMEMASAYRKESAIASAKAFKQQAQSGNTSSNNNTAATLSALDEMNLAAAYDPRAFRASSMYEILRARAVRRVMRSKGGGNEKLQKITMAGMALGSVGILVFVMLLFSNP